MNDTAGITCAICTYKSPSTLVDTLDSLLQQDTRDLNFEVLVVDNGGDPATMVAVDAARKKRREFPLRAVRETRLGLSNARNRAIQEAAFDIVAFIDDDACAAPKWLGDLFQAFDNSDVWAAGGPVFPAWECLRPDWLSDSMLRSLSVVEWGTEDRWLAWPERVIGTNMAFRKAALVQLGGFDPAFGREGNNLVGMEEVVLQERMSGDGKPVYYLADAGVHHRIPKSRCTFRYFFRRSYAHAISMSRADPPQPVGVRDRYLRPMKVVLVDLFAFLKAPFYRRKKSIRPLMKLANSVGTLRSILALTTSHKPGKPNSNRMSKVTSANPS